jgi:uncharacterized protein YbjT (DUF2867 family)
VVNQWHGKGSAVILITGATGSIGRALTTPLGEQQDVDFRTASRSGGRKQAANDVAMDFADSASVAAALRGADVERVTGRPATTVERFITDHKAAFAPENGAAS